MKGPVSVWFSCGGIWPEKNKEFGHTHENYSNVLFTVEGKKLSLQIFIINRFK